MDGRGRWLDNVFIERLWRSVKHEEVYLKAYENLVEARRARRLLRVLQPPPPVPRAGRRNARSGLLGYTTYRASNSCMRSSEPPTNPVQLSRPTRPPLYFHFYNHRRRHQGLDDATPDQVYWATLRTQQAAA